MNLYKDMMRNIFLMIIGMMAFFGCNSESDQAIVNISDIEEIDGFIDIPLSITDKSEVGGYYQYLAEAIYNADTIGILISLKKDIPAGFVDGEPKNMFIDKGIQFNSSGDKSDKLLNVLGILYGEFSPGLSIKDKQVFTCANLNQVSTNYNSGESKFKIFLENEEDYAELFVNFDFTNDKIFLNEKDPEYRKSLLKLMQKPGK